MTHRDLKPENMTLPRASVLQRAGLGLYVMLERAFAPDIAQREREVREASKRLAVNIQDRVREQFAERQKWEEERAYYGRLVTGLIKRIGEYSDENDRLRVRLNEANVDLERRAREADSYREQLGRAEHELDRRDAVAEGALDDGTFINALRRSVDLENDPHGDGQAIRRPGWSPNVRLRLCNGRDLKWMSGAETPLVTDTHLTLDDINATDWTVIP